MGQSDLRSISDLKDAILDAMWQAALDYQQNPQDQVINAVAMERFASAAAQAVVWFDEQQTMAGVIRMAAVRHIVRETAANCPVFDPASIEPFVSAIAPAKLKRKRRAKP